MHSIPTRPPSDASVHAHYASLIGLNASWKVTSVTMDTEAMKIVIAVAWEKNESAPCPECAAPCTIADHREERSWRHLDTMQFTTIITARVPRADCPSHGVKTIDVPWAGIHSRFTLFFEAFALDVLAAAKSITSAMRILRLSWDQIHRVMRHAVKRGLARRSLEELKYVGIDEKSFLSGHRYASLLTDIAEGRVLDVVQERTKEAAETLWNMIPEAQREKISAVAMDMWDPFIRATAAIIPGADVVHDKFHIIGYLGKAVDAVRKRENRELQQEGNDLLKGTKYLWLTAPKNRTKTQWSDFRLLQQEHLKVGRAWAMMQAFKDFWNFTYEKSARSFFARWYFWATHSKLRPMVVVAKMLKRHLPNILTYLRHRITNAVTEGLNSKIQSIKANARGFRNFENYRIAILFHCGKLQMQP